jgi:hypothetical protein
MFASRFASPLTCEYLLIPQVEPPNQHSIIGGRLFGQKDIAEHGDEIADALIMAAMPEPTQIGFDVGHIVNPGHGVPEVDNPTHPAWRNASSFVITNVIIEPNESWERKKEREKFNTNVVGKAFRELSPNGASYVNEVGELQERSEANPLTGCRVTCWSQIGKMPTGAQTTPDS